MPATFDRLMHVQEVGTARGSARWNARTSCGVSVSTLGGQILRQTKGPYPNASSRKR